MVFVEEERHFSKAFLFSCLHEKTTDMGLTQKTCETLVLGRSCVRHREKSDLVWALGNRGHEDIWAEWFQGLNI